MPKQLPVPIQRSEYDRLLPVEKMHYDMLTNKEGYDFAQSKTTVRVSPQFFVTIPDPPRGYDPAQGRGGGKFYAPAEGKVVYVEKDAEGNVTYTEREYPARTVHFRNAAELQQELDRRRVQGEFSRGRDGLFGLVPFDIYQQKEATARVEAEIDKLGPGAARGLDDDVRNPELIKDSDPVGDALPEPEQVKEREEVPDKPVTESKDVAADITETQRLERDKKAQAEGRAETTDTSRRATPAAKRAKSRPPEDKAESSPPDVGDVVKDPALPKQERKDPEKEPSPPEDEPASDEELKKIQRELDEKDVFDQLQQALQPVKEEEPRAELIAAATGAPQRGALSARDPEALPEPTDDPDLLVELAEGPEDPPMVEAEAVDELPVTQPPTLPEEPVDIDVELEQEDTPSAEEIESFAADTIGMEYLRGAFVEFARYAYDPSSPLDRRRMDFLAKFLQDAQFPQGDERALVARKAFDRMKAQSVEQMKEG
jgi:hypothetical protein